MLFLILLFKFSKFEVIFTPEKEFFLIPVWV